MSKITTDDCKAYILKMLPNTDIKKCKRIRKFKNDNGDVVREFSLAEHPETMHLVEINGKLEFGTGTVVTKLNGYLFHVMDTEDGMMVITTDEQYWLENGCVNDQEDEMPGLYMPPEWSAEDLNGCGSWLIETELNKKEVTKVLLAKGFKQLKAFSDFIKHG